MRLSMLIYAAAVLAGSTNLVKYSGLGYSGSYYDITNMDESSGKCSSSLKSFSGNLSPLDEELSVHIRGPINLKNFAVYTPGSSSLKKRDAPCQNTVNLRHVHKRETTVVDVKTVLVERDAASPTASFSAVSQPTSSSSSSSSSAGSWSRSSYYSADGTANNVVFMNHLGDSSLSGTWSSTFGNSLSYSDSKGTSCSAKSVILDDVTLASDKEVVLFSSEECDDSCGYYREDIPAMKGWAGKNKVFVFNFTMPTATDSTANNHDMPAVWLLNAKIPRTLQYGDPSCSCWSSGCGELDLWEVITSGSNELTNHIHDGQGDEHTSSGGGGSSDYFKRPVDRYLCVAAIFDGSEIILTEVGSDFAFDSSLEQSAIESWYSSYEASKAILLK